MEWKNAIEMQSIYHLARQNKHKNTFIHREKVQKRKKEEEMKGLTVQVVERGLHSAGAQL